MQTAFPAPAVKQGFNSQIRTTVLRFRAGQLIFDEGQKATRWYEVVRGTVRTCRFHIDGQRHLTGFFFGGDIFGADYGYYGTSAEAVTDVTVRCFRVGDVTHDYEPRPQLDETVAMLFRAMSSAQQYQFIMGHRTATDRLAAFLLCLQQRTGDDPQIYLPMSRSDIADFLGLTIHTVSRTFTDLAGRGLIKVDGRHLVIITDKAGLCKLAGEHHHSLVLDGDIQIHPAAELCLNKKTAA